MRLSLTVACGCPIPIETNGVAVRQPPSTIRPMGRLRAYGERVNRLRAADTDRWRRAGVTRAAVCGWAFLLLGVAIFVLSDDKARLRQSLWSLVGLGSWIVGVGLLIVCSGVVGRLAFRDARGGGSTPAESAAAGVRAWFRWMIRWW